MFSRYLTRLFPISILAIGLLVACDGTAEMPQVGEIEPQSITTMLVSETAGLTIEASGTDLQFKWTVNRGTLSDATKPSVLYTAPSSPGPDIVTVEVISRGGTVSRSITFQIVERTPTPTPTANPTETPIPSPTPTPLPPLLDVLAQATEGQKFVFKNESGELIDRYEESEECRHSGNLGLKLTYQMAGNGNGGWGVQWDKAARGSFDASMFSSLVVWVKGDSGGETFQIGLADTSGKEVKLESIDLVTVSAAEWRMVAVPLSKFEGVNTASIKNVNLGFNSNHGSGAICVDDIAFAP
ncbi:MAG TPA: hypothetical protein VIK33_15500 [Anaerolineae bacterium]